MFAAAALLVSLLVFGLEPALLLTRAGKHSDPEHRPANPTTRMSRHRALLRWQVGISVALFLVAGVFGTLLIDDARRDTGVDLDHLALATVHFGAQRWNEPQARRVLEDVLNLAQRTPGLESAAVSSGAPFGMTLTTRASVSVIEDGGRKAAPEGIDTDLLAASPTIFQTLGVPITRGRAFDERDEVGSPRVAVVSERTARSLFGTAQAVGREVTLKAWGRPPAETFTVIGIAGDTDGGVGQDRTRNTLYVPFTQHYEPNLVLLARTAGSASAAAQALRSAIRRVNPDLSVGMAGTASLLLAAPMAMVRLLATATAALGGLALLLAMVGLYGVLALFVAQRTHEMGVRLSLGADPRQIEWLVLRQGFRPVIEGFVIGVLFGVVARLAVRAVLVGTIAVFDPIALVLLPVPLGLVALLACYVPARRAGRMDPNVVLRDL